MRPSARLTGTRRAQADTRSPGKHMEPEGGLNPAASRRGHATHLRWVPRPALKDGVSRGVHDARPTQEGGVPRRGRGALPSLMARGFRPGYVLSALIVLGLLLAWQGAVTIGHVESYLMPSPLQVARSFGEADTRSLILNNMGVTIEEALVGFGVCLAVGVALAVAMFTSRVVRDALYPLLIASQAIPTIAIGAVLVIALGYGMAPKVVVVTLYAFFAVTVNVYDSLLSLDPELPALLKTLGASPWQVLRTARLPAALPGLFTGAKLAVTYSISGAIYGEWVGATGGLGYALQMASNQLAAATVWAIVIVMAALGLASFGLVALLERLCVPWARDGGGR
jgi:putative hydroxymethylpyrimidine transport system permease protein